MTSSPLIRMEPLDGSINLLIILSVVDLPHPEGPTRTTVSPAPIRMVTLSTDG